LAPITRQAMDRIPPGPAHGLKEDAKEAPYSNKNNSAIVNKNTRKI